MNDVDVVKIIKDTMPFEFVTLDQICSKHDCDNNISGVKYPDEEPRIMKHHDERFEFGQKRFYPVNLTICSPCLLKDGDIKSKRSRYHGTAQMKDYESKQQT